MTTFEVCACSLQSALAAQTGGANRVELCSALSIGGITPSIGVIEMVRDALQIDVNVLVRPRQGDFLYSQQEVDVMAADILSCAKIGVNGVVIGALDRHGKVDMEVCRRLVDLAKSNGLSVTFHRAVDRSCNPVECVNDIILLGADRILTSGGAKSALQGAETISRMCEVAGGKISIMPGAGVNAENIKEILAVTGVKEIHFSGTTQIESQMEYRGGVSFTPDSLGGDFTITESSEEKIREIIAAAEKN